MNRLFILMIFLMSCVSLATNGSPVITPKDGTSAGIGLSGVISPSGAFPLAPVIYFRYGLSENTDIGFSGFPILGIFNTDVKFRNSNFTALIFGTGVSYTQIDNDWIFFILPNFGLGFGNEKFYISPRFIYALATSRDTLIPSSILQTSFGLTLGKSVKFNPEMGFYIPLDRGDIAFYFNFGVFYMPKK